MPSGRYAECMAAQVTIYTTNWCGYCTSALRLLEAKGVVFERIDVGGNPTLRRWLVEQTGRTSVPQIFIDSKPIGGFTDLRALDQRGLLDDMLAGRGPGHSSASG
jgi:glutaredoxin 3